MSLECIFCKIAQRQIPAQVLSESADWISFRDIQPQAPTHFIIIPKVHIPNLLAVRPEQRGLLGSMMEELARLAGEYGVAESGFRVVNNCNRDGGQTVGHLHLHLLAGRSLNWPPG
ncbi:MAG: histidine triad nucleotide-binding protein [Candidatus Omnitrophica bacterium]|jgi:histidine triad (HIT) family protein|nr:histidine triad nucleotide-binding protein [Candidatus Omnitrophota bacterium]